MANFTDGNSASSRAGAAILRRSLLLCPAIALSLSPLLTLSCAAQVSAPSTGAPAIINDVRTSPSTTILPTDVVPLAGDLERNSFAENLQLRVLQRLPARLYFSASCEVTGRWESNPFQFPTKRVLLRSLPPPQQFRTLSTRQQAEIYDIIGLTGRSQGVFRALPNVSGGWTLTPHTRLFTNYFMIRDHLSHSNRLNTVIHSYAIGLQQDVPIGTKGSLQLELQGRELWQLHQQSVFDYLPGLTFSYIVTPRMVAFVNALVQMRGKAPMQAPVKELDPFYTWGLLYQKNGWTFSASTTFVQNFRHPFRNNATIPRNNYVLISDFEVARRVVKQYPGLQAFVRAEPIWNMHSNQTPGLSGMDMRLFAGMRFAMAKPALTATLNQIREQLQETEPAPTAPTTKPSAQNQMISPAELVAHNPQPIHGFLERDAMSETCMNPDGDNVLIADESQESGSTQSAVSNSENSVEKSSNSIASSIADSESVEQSVQSSNQDSSIASNTESAEKANSAPAAATSPKNIADSAPARTLEMIAKSTSDASSSAGSSPSILDLETAPVDMDKIAQSALAMPGSASPVHELIDQAQDQSNVDSLKDRSAQIKEMAARKEAEHKLAMASMPQPMMPGALKSLPVLTMREPQALAGSKKSSTNLLPHQPTTAIKTQTAAPFVAQFKDLTITAASKKLEPLPSGNSPEAHSSHVPPNMVVSEKKLVQPVQVAAKSDPKANIVPTPVPAKPSVQNVLSLKADTSIAVTKEIPSTGTAKLLANKDGSIPLSEVKIDKTPRIADSAPVKIASASIPSLNTAALKIESKPSLLKEPVKPTASNSNSSAINGNIADARRNVAEQAKIKLQTKPIPTTPPPAVVEEINAAVSALSETEISSPKIAMASYESWQSPVIDDPLIGEEVRHYADPNAVANLSSAIEKDSEKLKSSDKKKTAMKLIPPFPTIEQSAKQGSSLKNNPLDIKIPVLPVH